VSNRESSFSLQNLRGLKKRRLVRRRVRPDGTKKKGARDRASRRDVVVVVSGISGGDARGSMRRSW
jgi:hypothetical protein